MAIILIKGRTDAIHIPNDKARKIKTLRFGDVDGKGKADPRDGIDLEVWVGEIGAIKSIEFEREVKITPPPPPEKPLTPEEKKSFREQIDAIGKEFGFNSKKVKTYTLNRSALNEYFEKNGKHFDIPATAQIIEDVDIML